MEKRVVTPAARKRLTEHMISVHGSRMVAKLARSPGSLHRGFYYRARIRR